MKISRYKYSISQNLFFHCGQGLFSVNLLSEFDKSEFFRGGGGLDPPDPLFPSRFGHAHIYQNIFKRFITDELPNIYFYYSFQYHICHQMMHNSKYYNYFFAHESSFNFDLKNIFY